MDEMEQALLQQQGQQLKVMPEVPRGEQVVLLLEAVAEPEEPERPEELTVDLTLVECLMGAWVLLPTLLG
jgi:hypothetical protein